MKKLIAVCCLSLFVHSNSFAMNGDCEVSGGPTIKNGAQGCVMDLKVSCSNGQLSFIADPAGNAIPCGPGGLANKPVKASLMNSKLKK